jgi:hypothetical protein
MQTKAVIFFNDSDELSVLDRKGRIEPLQASPFAKQLDVCLVYLDEVHIRGTDLRLPKDYRAVTLGANLTKDRLVLVLISPRTTTGCCIVTSVCESYWPDGHIVPLR